MSDPNPNVKEFIDVTGEPEERAKFFLEAAGGELSLALQSYYEHDGELQEAMQVGGSGNVETFPRPNPTPSKAKKEVDSDAEDDRSRPVGAKTASAAAAGSKGKSRGGPPPAGPRSGLVTLDSLKREAEAAMHSSDDSSDDEDRQAFYAGQGQHGGQQILGPRKKPESLIEDMFKQARERGAEEEETTNFVDMNMVDPSKRNRGAGAGFSGMGYKLGDTPETSSSATVEPSDTSEQNNPRGREVFLRLWSNGFTVDNGPLRDYQDPVNSAFLNSVKKGEVPQELVRSSGGAELSLAMVDKRMEEYTAPKVASRPFTGTGQMLGSPAPSVVSGSDSNKPSSEADKVANETVARSQINLIESEPTTNVQLRLADGSRLVGRFNHSHTVRDLHTFINTARPQFTTLNYVLVLFPNTEMNKFEDTLKEANLLNAAVVQKMKP